MDQRPLRRFGGRLAVIRTEAGLIMPGEVVLDQKWYFGRPDSERSLQIDSMMVFSRNPFLQETHQRGLNFDGIEQFMEAKAKHREQQRKQRNASPRAMPPWPIQSRDRGPNGLRVCRCGCGREVQPPKRAWFSQDCHRQASLKHDWRALRNHVFTRDKFACVKCLSNTQLECDHIIPLAEGGGHDVSNLRTLCYVCHKKETKALLARLVPSPTSG
jgi:hypothetical protein